MRPRAVATRLISQKRDSQSALAIQEGSTFRKPWPTSLTDRALRLPQNKVKLSQVNPAVVAIVAAVATQLQE